LNQATEAQVQQDLAQTPEAQQMLRRRAMRRVTIASSLILALGLFLSWLPAGERNVILIILSANRWVIALLFVFGAIALSLLWSSGQRLDVWVFQALNLRGYHATWLDAAMWVSTQIGNFLFICLLAFAAYLLGNHSYTYNLILGSITLWLVVETIKALTDRARPFNLLRETRVIGYQEPGLSFPSGHTAQTFFLMTLTIRHFQLPLWAAATLYFVAALVAFTRVYLGVHYPRDVMAGATLGIIWGILGVMLAPYV
jgi:membrane-associated phospholipid phosphatase